MLREISENKFPFRKVKELNRLKWEHAPWNNKAKYSFSPEDTVTKEQWNISTESNG